MYKELMDEIEKTAKEIREKSKFSTNYLLTDSLRKSIPDEVAKQLVSVQPMDYLLLKNLLEAGSTEEELVADGYEPISEFKLMYIKRDDINE